MALSSTCRMFRTAIEGSMLVVDAKQDSLGDDMDIPIFASDQCHSVFLTCQVLTRRDENRDYRFVIMSRERYSKGAFDNVVWDNTKHSGSQDGRRLTFHISFCNNPSQEYCIRVDCNEPIYTFYYIELRKQFMTSALKPAMKGALTHCLRMGGITNQSWHSSNSLMEVAKMKLFFMRLYVLSFECLPEASSPIRRLFESESSRRTRRWCDFHSVQKQILNFYDQVLEQKEPIDCVKLPLSSHEDSYHRFISPHSWYRTLDNRERESQTWFLPHLCLNEKFLWKRGKRRRCNQDDDVLPVVNKDELVFIARIPLASKTKRFTFSAYVSTDSPASVFVFFLQKRHSVMDTLEYPIDGKVLVREGIFLCFECDVDVNPEHDACYLYFVPGNATKMELELLEIRLEIEQDDQNRDFDSCRDMLRGCRFNETGSEYGRFFPLALFRDCAQALLGPDEGRYKSLKEAFEVEKIDSTPESLQCIIDICRTLFQTS